MSLRPCHSLCKGTETPINPSSSPGQGMPWQHLHPLSPLCSTCCCPHQLGTPLPCSLTHRHPTAPGPSSAEVGTLRVSFAFRGGFACLCTDLWVGGVQPHLTVLVLCARWVIPRVTHPFCTFLGPLVGQLPSSPVKGQQCSGWL